MFNLMRSRGFPYIIFSFLWVLLSFGTPVKEIIVYNWQGYIPKDVLEKFTQETGIQVVYDSFASAEALEAKLLVQSSGYDVVFPPAYPVLGRGIQAGLFLPLNRELIPNADKVSESLLQKLDPIDPERKYAVPYLWGTTGIGYDAEALQKAGIKVDSWGVLFDPQIARHLKSCRQSFLDAPLDVLQAALLYLRKSPSTLDPSDWEEAAKVVMAVRPSIASFEEGSRQIESLVNGSSHLLLGYSTYINIARVQGKALPAPRNIQYALPREGAVVWFDMMAIPKDAPNPEGAHLFINFILRPDVIARISNQMRAANAIPESYAAVDPLLRSDPAIFPSEDMIQNLHSDFLPPLKLLRHISRLWLKIKMHYRP